jgi:nucleoside phosphorylase
MFQLYGAPIMCDLVTVLKEGGVAEAIFFGYAYGIAESLRVGDCVLPTEVQTLDGVTARLGAGPYVQPHADMTRLIAEALERQHVPFQAGKSVSVPATFWHGDESIIDADALALELEFAAFCHCASVAGLNAGGVLVISDTREQGLLDERPPRDPVMLEVFRAVKSHWEQRSPRGEA